jgi:hypothetical protein
MLCALSRVVGRSVDFTKYVRTITANRHLQGVQAVAPHFEDTRRSILVVGIRVGMDGARLRPLVFRRPTAKADVASTGALA